MNFKQQLVKREIFNAREQSDFSLVNLLFVFFARQFVRTLMLASRKLMNTELCEVGVNEEDCIRKVGVFRAKTCPRLINFS